jgi:hypothetical protein
MKPLSRRSVTAGLAAAVTAIPTVGLCKGARSDDDQAWRDLWRQTINGEVAYANAARVEDEASGDARDDYQAHRCPWTPRELRGEWEHDASQRIVSSTRETIGLVRGVTVIQRDDGIWTVAEYQPSGSNNGKPPYFNDEYPQRWQEYPDATTAEEAHAMAAERSEKEWRSYRAKRAAVSRRHRIVVLKAAIKSSGDECLSIRLRMARTPGASPTAVAVKMAIALVCTIPLNFGDEWDQDNEDTADLESAEHLALSSAYRAVAKNAGYDPVAEWRNTPGI